jgi:hypothetical protein
MPKGEKLRPKQMDQPTTCKFQKLQRILGLIKILLLQNFVFLWGRILIVGKRGSLWHLIKFALNRSLDLPKQVFLI